jgi:hypothetical protein
VNLTVIVGALLLSAGPLWKLLGNHVLTLVHESGHAVTAIAVGSFDVRVRVQPDGSGVTDSIGPSNGVLSGLAGFTSPSILGLVLLWASYAVAPTVVLVGCLILLVAILVLMIRSIFGALLAAALASGTALTYLYGTAWTQQTATSIAAWLLLLGAVRNTLTLARVKEDDDDDAANLEKRVGLPRGFWVYFFVLFSLASLALAVWGTLGFPTRF